MGVNPDQLQWWVAALTLLLYAAVMTASGWALTRLRDVGWRAARSPAEC